jgi:hypothetical protein
MTHLRQFAQDVAKSTSHLQVASLKCYSLCPQQRGGIEILANPISEETLGLNQVNHQRSRIENTTYSCSKQHVCNRKT